MHALTHIKAACWWTHCSTEACSQQCSRRNYSGHSVNERHVWHERHAWHVVAPGTCFDQQCKVSFWLIRAVYDEQMQQGFQGSERAISYSASQDTHCCAAENYFAKKIAASNSVSKRQEPFTCMTNCDQSLSPRWSFCSQKGLLADRLLDFIPFSIAGSSWTIIA